MQKIKILSVLFLSLIFFMPVQSQGILNRVLKESSRKIEREVSNMVVNKVSDMITRKATQSIESAFDKMIQEQMAADSNYVNRTDVPDSVYYKTGQKYGAFLAGLNNSANLPDQYVFDIHILSETTDHDGTTHEMKMYFSKDQAVVGIEQMEEKQAGTFMVMDIENDIMAIYQDKDGKKTVQAIPSMLGMGAGMVDEDDYNFEFKPTGKTKKIAGYEAKGYKAETKKVRMTVFSSTELPIDWKDSFGKMVQRIAPAAYIDGSQEMSGMILESVSTEKKKPYKGSSYLAKEVVEKVITINNTEYEKASYGG